MLLLFAKRMTSKNFKIISDTNNFLHRVCKPISPYLLFKLQKHESIKYKGGSISFRRLDKLHFHNTKVARINVLASCGLVSIVIIVLTNSENYYSKQYYPRKCLLPLLLLWSI